MPEHSNTPVLDEMKRTRDALRAQALFDRLVIQKQYVKAGKVAWYLYLQHGIDVGLVDGRDIIGWSRNY